MSRNVWKTSLALTILAIAWAFYSIYPPTPRDLIRVFEKQAEYVDTNFTAIVEQARSLQEANPDHAFRNLQMAVGTNDLIRYFPSLADEEAADQNRQILNQIQRRAAGKIKLGLDLQGGTSFLVAMDTNRFENVVDKRHALEQAMEVLRKRVDRFGVAEPQLQPQGENRILIQIPGLSEADKESAKSTLQRAAFLEFRMVHPQSAELVQQEIVEPGYEIKEERTRRRDGQEPQPTRRYLLRKTPERGLTGKHVDRSGVYLDPVTGSPRINLLFKSEGASLFADITREHVGHQMAIVLDGELYSAPVIRTEILGGSCEISGDFDLREANELANVLQNPLEAPVHIEEERTVDPSLGQDSIDSGFRASIIAATGTFVFMIIFYFASGLVANLALALNVFLLMGAMCAMDSTLTMPGIAGIALAVGMAVDANVLIYERMREEIAAGKSIRGVVSAGYHKAFGTILDSNVTTLIASVILIYMGTGPVKGFGVTLTIGIVASFFTALVVTRLIYDYLLSKNWIRTVRMLPLIRIRHLPFMNWGKFTVATSLILILAGIGYGIARGHKSLGVDFVGGDVVQFRFTERVPVDDLRRVMDQAGLGDSLIQYQQQIGAPETLQIMAGVGTGSRMEEALQESFPRAGMTAVGTDSVGPSVGAQIQRSAIIATLLAMFGILVYVAFRYEFSFAVASVLALLHDVLLTMGIYFLSGRQLTAPMVAAILTIIGYSTNDKIVIMDRIREDLKLGIRGSFRELIDIALNQTLSRTIITGSAVLLATLALYVFGGNVINDLAFAFLIGILSGTYSSMMIACPIVLWWHKGQRPKIGAEAVAIDQTAIAASQGRVKPA